MERAMQRIALFVTYGFIALTCMLAQPADAQLSLDNHGFFRPILVSLGGNPQTGAQYFSANLNYETLRKLVGGAPGFKVKLLLKRRGKEFATMNVSDHFGEYPDSKNWEEPVMYCRNVDSDGPIEIELLSVAALETPRIFTGRLTVHARTNPFVSVRYDSNIIVRSADRRGEFVALVEHYDSASEIVLIVPITIPQGSTFGKATAIGSWGKAKLTVTPIDSLQTKCID
jgi:hypothetical protein